MRNFASKFVVPVLIVVLSACSPPPAAEAPIEDGAFESVWTVDLVKTLPGQQGNYMRNIEANWNSGRNIARSRGAVLSYQAMVAPQDSSRGWDIILMTEYSDSTEWSRREVTFQEIFASDEFIRFPSPLPSSEMREFAAGGVVMRAFVSEPGR